jgi:heterodisulfide reductase subunit D
METPPGFSFAASLTKLQLIGLDACTRCYECLNYCPVLDITDETAWSTPEKLRLYGALVRAQDGLPAKLFGRPRLDERTLATLTEALYTCTTCGVCGEVCPVGINTQELWPQLRAKMVELGLGPWGAQKTTDGIVRERHNPYDKPHGERFAWLPDDVPVAEHAEVGFYVGCSGAYVAQPMMIGAVRMLHAAGIEFTLFDDEWCCSFPLYVIGKLEQCAELTRHNIEGFAARGVKRLIVSCPCCTFTLQNLWPRFYGADLPFEIVHITQVMAEAVAGGQLKFSRSTDETLVYHDSCYLARGVRLVEEPRQVLSAIPDVRLVEMERNRERAKCCGAGGGIRRAKPELSIAMARALIHDAERVGATTLVLSCPACFERVNLARQGLDTPLKIRDLMQVVSELV